MTKSELIEAVANKLKLPKGKAELIVNCVFDSMEGALTHGERIEIRGFGSFEIRNYKSYEGRNPRTGTKVDVRPKRLPFFKVGKELKERVNNGLAAPPPAAPPERPPETSLAAQGSDETPALPPTPVRTATN
jgi:integration host factor subunit beta